MQQYKELHVLELKTKVPLQFRIFWRRVPVKKKWGGVGDVKLKTWPETKGGSIVTKLVYLDTSLKWIILVDVGEICFSSVGRADTLWMVQNLKDVNFSVLHHQASHPCVGYRFDLDIIRCLIWMGGYVTRLRK